MSVEALTWALNHAPVQLTKDQRLVLISLADCAEPDGTHALASYSQIATHTGLSAQEIEWAIADLEAAGLLSKTAAPDTYDIRIGGS